MLEDFEEDIPAMGELRLALQADLADPRTELEDVHQMMTSHILRQQGVDRTSLDQSDEDTIAFEVAFPATESLIAEMEVNEVNFRRLQRWIAHWDSYAAYDKLVLEFDDVMSGQEYGRIVRDGKRIFVEGLTTHWTLALRWRGIE